MPPSNFGSAGRFWQQAEATDMFAVLRIPCIIPWQPRITLSAQIGLSIGGFMHRHSAT